VPRAPSPRSSNSRRGTEQAFLYERQFFSPEAGDWPDFRHKELGEYVYERRYLELRRRLRDDPSALAFTPHYMTAWCHGAAGIAPTRVRAWRVLGADVYRDEAVAALATVRLSLGDGPARAGNYSLCHGIGGNADALLAADGCGLADDRALVTRAALDGVERYELAGAPWAG
jgi:lantibiotic modifying enzyme